jgi:hypothetical protein
MSEFVFFLPPPRHAQDAWFIDQNVGWRSEGDDRVERPIHGPWTAAHVQRPGCGGTLQSPVQCTDETFLDELDQGVHPAGLTVAGPAGATRVIEVFVPDPTLYPNATHAVHQALTQ